MTTQKAITSVSLTHATVGDQPVAWAELIDAAVQDTVGCQRLSCGALAWPNDDHATGDAYRDILRGSLPLIGREREAAYKDYCGQGVTTRDATPGSPHLVGHGSWVSGPDAVKQATYQAWDRLHSQVAAAAQGRVR